MYVLPCEPLCCWLPFINLIERAVAGSQGMGNFAKKARENAQEAILQAKKQAAMRLK